MNIKVDLSKFLKSESKFALVYINPNIQKTVIEVTAHICRLFGIQNEDSGSNTNFEKYSLFDGVWFIHPYQSSQLFSSLEGRILRLSFNENENSCLSPSPHKPTNTLTPLENLDQTSKHSEEITETIRVDVESEKMSQNTEEKDSIYSVDDNSSVTSVGKRRKRPRKHNRSKKNKKMDFDLSLVTADWVVPKTLSKSNPGNFHYKSKNYSLDPAKINRNHKVFTDEDDEEEDKGVLNSSSTKDPELDTSFSQSYPNGNRDDQLYHSTPTQTQTLDSDASSLQIDSLIELKKKELLNSLSRSSHLSHAANSARNKTPNELLLNHDLDSTPSIEASPEKSSPTTQHMKSRKFKLSPPNGSNPKQPHPENLLKFKNLLALERRSNPKVFCRWEQNTISMQDGWESLPLSFGSRKNRAEFDFNENSKQSNYYDTFKQNLSKNMHNSNSPSNSYIQQNFSKINVENVSDSISFSTPIEQNGNLLTKDFIGNNVNNSISLSPAIEPNETSVTQNFIGARPQKQNKRYYMSVGNVLKALKAPSDRSENGVEQNPEIALLSTEHSQRSTDQNWENTNNKDDVKRKGRVRKEDSVEEVMLEEGNNIGNDVSQVDVTQSCPVLKEWRPLPKEENSRMNGSETGCDDAPPIFVNLCEEKIITYESYPILSSLPKIQDIIAMKLLSLDANMCPCYSEYRPAKVVSLNGLNIGLEFLDGNSGAGLPQEQ